MQVMNTEVSLGRLMGNLRNRAQRGEPRAHQLADQGIPMWWSDENGGGRSQTGMPTRIASRSPRRDLVRLRKMVDQLQRARQMLSIRKTPWKRYSRRVDRTKHAWIPRWERLSARRPVAQKPETETNFRLAFGFSQDYSPAMRTRGTRFTPKQKQIYDYIRTYTIEHGYSPSLIEIRDHMGLS